MKVSLIIILCTIISSLLHGTESKIPNWKEWRKYFNKSTCPTEICGRKIEPILLKERTYYSEYRALQKEELNEVETYYRKKIEELQAKSLYKDDRLTFKTNKTYVVEPEQGEFLYSHKESPRQISDHKLIKTIFEINGKKISHGSLNTLLMADSLTGELGRTTVSSERVYDIFHYLIANDLDIIALQEVFSQQSDSKRVPKNLKTLEGIFPGERARLVLIRLLTLAGYNVITDAGKNNFFNGKFENSGLLIASKFKLSDNQFYSYTFDGHVQSQMTDKLADKGILRTTLSLSDGKKVIVYNTHTQASLWEWDLYNKTMDQAIALENKNIKARVKQFRYLASILEKENNYDFLICSGDFNLSDKFLNKSGDTLIYQDDPQQLEVKTYKILFSKYLGNNFLEENTWIPEYHKKDDKVYTGDYRINGVLKLKNQGNLSIVEKKGKIFLNIPLNNDAQGKTRKRPYKYNIEWGLSSKVAFDQVLYKAREAVS